MILAAAMLFSCTGTGESGTQKGKDDLSGSDSDSGSGQVSVSTVDRIADARAASEQALAAVQMGDFDGMSFIVTCTSQTKMFGEYEEATLISQERYLRMEALGTRLNLSIIQTEAEIESIRQGLKNEKNSGMIYTHLLLVDARDIGGLHYSNLIGNVGSLPFVDLSKPYYDAEFCDEMRTPSGLYALWGDACRDYDSLMCVFYNDTLRSELEIEELDALARSGAWTYDKMVEYAKLAAASTTDENAVYGILNADSDKFFRSAFVAAGMDSVSLSGKTLSVNDNTKLGNSLVESIKGIIDSGAYTAGDVVDKISEDVFFDGDGLFFISSLGVTKSIFNMKDVWGLLPIPVIAEGDGYAAPLTKKTSVICYPRSASDLNEIGIFVESLFACSYKVLDAAYYDTYFHSYVRNQDTYDMLKLVLGDIRGDFALCYSDEFTNYSKGTFDAFVSACWGNTSYSSIFNNNRAAANRSLAYVG